LAFFAIHHASAHHRDFSQVPSALTEIARVLKPGGVLVYEEFVHRAAIRDWLASHGFSVISESRQLRRELLIVRKRS
jgi:ubiquinone/menaquinone biosynthesis C-methylase UbiE